VRMQILSGTNISAFEQAYLNVVTLPFLVFKCDLCQICKL